MICVLYVLRDATYRIWSGFIQLALGVLNRDNKIRTLGKPMFSSKS